MDWLEQSERDESMLLRLVKILVTCASLMTTTIVVANLLALKIWDFVGIPVDGGIWLFPVTYLVGDLLCEICGKKWADFVAILSAGCGAATVALFHLVNALPDYQLADNSAFAILAQSSGRVFVASIVSFLVGQLLNNLVFERLRQKAGRPQDYGKRSLGSSVPAHLVDVFCFETLAFYGRLPLGDFLSQVCFAFVAGLVIEVCLWPVAAVLVNRLARLLYYPPPHHKRHDLID